MDVVAGAAINGSADVGAATGVDGSGLAAADVACWLIAGDVAAIVLPGLGPPVDPHAAQPKRSVATTAVTKPARPPTLGTGKRIRHQDQSV